MITGLLTKLSLKNGVAVENDLIGFNERSKELILQDKAY
jgi:hypothetical protein